MTWFESDRHTSDLRRASSGLPKITSLGPSSRRLPLHRSTMASNQGVQFARLPGPEMLVPATKARLLRQQSSSTAQMWSFRQARGGSGAKRSGSRSDLPQDGEPGHSRSGK